MKKRFTEEQIIGLLQEADTWIPSGLTLQGGVRSVDCDPNGPSRAKGKGDGDRKISDVESGV